ncbi:MAG: 50S ribosomal protein L21 [Pseudomonadota bacterium]|nr:50S ribosomal protein L21 [Pseudomonadota bacterium]
MYAVVKTGGKQYRVAKDDVIIVEKLEADSGSSIELDEVLMLDDGKETVVGTPLIDGARIAATVLDQTRNEKIIVFKKKRRKDYKRKKGHRQDQTVLKINEILTKGQKASNVKRPEKAQEASVTSPREAAAAKPVTKNASAKKAPAKKAPAKKAPAKKASAKKASAKKASEKK